VNPCQSCGECAGIQHKTITIGETTHVLTCPTCGYQVTARTIREACEKWNEEGAKCSNA